MAINGIINPNAAANAYSNSQSITGGVGQVAKEGAGIKGFAQNAPISEGQPSFSDFLKQNVQSSVDTMKAGETMSAKAITGDANITDVVQAVTASELTLQTLVSVRDRMISAYQDIMRMPMSW